MRRLHPVGRPRLHDYSLIPHFDNIFNMCIMLSILDLNFCLPICYYYHSDQIDAYIRH